MTKGIFAVLSLFACFAAPLLAHHSFGAEYDANKPITVTGVLTKMIRSSPRTVDLIVKLFTVPVRGCPSAIDAIVKRMAKPNSNRTVLGMRVVPRGK